ncbi:MAG: response regulator transcription factor [Bacteroides sp.]|nr:response regulator transcription factor [Bacteroides sp.]
MTLNCIIIDDEPLARELIRSYVEQTPVLRLTGTFESAAEAIRTVVSGDIDVIFLDINMPMLNGIDFAGVVPSKTRIIFITAYEQYALQGFRVNALDYLLKPVSYPEFMKAVGKAVEWVNMRRSLEKSANGASEYITVKADYRLVQISMDRILYIEVQNDRVIFCRKDGDPVTSLMSMKELEEILPSERFMRVHRSFIVNLANIEIVERQRIVFGNTYIPVSDSKKEEFFARFTHHKV